MAKGTRTEGLRPELPLRAAVRVGQYKSVILKREAFVSQKNRRFQQTSPCRRPRRAISRPTNTEVRRAECDSVGTAVALRANSTSSQSELGRSVCFIKKPAVSTNSIKSFTLSAGFIIIPRASRNPPKRGFTAPVEKSSSLRPKFVLFPMEKFEKSLAKEEKT